MSVDHKPSNPKEKKRIIQNGGTIYQTKTTCKFNVHNSASIPKYGPLRIIPGRLSVSRAFGDFEAKFPSLGGNPNVLIAEPEIKSFEINDH
jgi:protein phosphatase PTC2/3